MGLTILRHDLNIDFVGMRRAAYLISILLLVFGLAAAIYSGGPRYSVDFAGGVAAQVQFSNSLGDEIIKSALSERGLPGLAVQQFGESGKDYLIRFALPELSADGVRSLLTESLGSIQQGTTAEILRMEMVGPKVGADLRNAALEAMYYAILFITVYISGRFEQRWFIAAFMAAFLSGGMYLVGMAGVGMAWRVPLALLVTLIVSWKIRLNFAFGAIVSLLHDVLITVGVLILLGREFDLNIIAALLTLVGYSLNDTIIVYDRIRENLRAQDVNNPEPLAHIINLSINQTLSRTVLTSGTTALAALSLFLLGGGVIHDFALTMLLGVTVGTLSSMFIASPILLAFGDTAQYITPSRRKDDFEAPGEHGIV